MSLSPPPDSPGVTPVVEPRTYARFESELQVRPDDLDMNRHVHASRYLDYVLAARYDQMERCYRMSVEEFEKLGLAWFVQTSHIEYKRPLALGERFIVRTWVREFARTGVTVDFAILKQANGKISAQGWCHYSLVRADTGRAENIPDWIVARYSI